MESLAPPRPLARWTCIALGVSGIASAGEALLTGVLVGEGLLDPTVVSDDPYSSVPEALLSLSVCGRNMLLLATGVLFLFYVAAAARACRRLGARALEFTEGWAVAWFVIPIASLWMPYRVTSELWRASDPEHGSGTDWVGRSLPALLGLWWSAWVGFSILDRLLNLGGRWEWAWTTRPATLAAFALSALVASALAIRVIAGLQTRLETRAARAPEPAPASEFRKSLSSRGWSSSS